MQALRWLIRLYQNAGFLDISFLAPIKHRCDAPFNYSTTIELL